MAPSLTHPVVHLELRTANLAQACAFYTHMFNWRVEHVRAGSASYVALELAHGVQGGVVELERDQPAWLPYVEVADIADATERARRLGADVLLAPREGAAGWRSVLTVPAAAQIALWQPKL